MMGSAFDSFDESPLGGFIDSGLDARGESGQEVIETGMIAQNPAVGGPIREPNFNTCTFGTVSTNWANRWSYNCFGDVTALAFDPTKVKLITGVTSGYTHTNAGELLFATVVYESLAACWQNGPSQSDETSGDDDHRNYMRLIIDKDVVSPLWRILLDFKMEGDIQVALSPMPTHLESVNITFRA